MAEECIERRDGGYYFAGSRVSLDSVYEFLKGESPEAIVQSFPSLSLLQVYGAITFYLGNRDEVDGYLKRAEVRFDELAQTSRKSNPLLYAKLEAARRTTRLMRPRFQADET